mmetsp:Transcript_103774/g.334590  ORF Transcript_103774/g.334590 Transcript_103774/m.334590 type:complete len:204 (+) Transcript_103774:2266-2877(+)
MLHMMSGSSVWMPSRMSLMTLGCPFRSFRCSSLLPACVLDICTTSAFVRCCVSRAPWPSPLCIASLALPRPPRRSLRGCGPSSSGGAAAAGRPAPGAALGGAGGGCGRAWAHGTASPAWGYGSGVLRTPASPPGGLPGGLPRNSHGIKSAIVGAGPAGTGQPSDGPDMGCARPRAACSMAATMGETPVAQGPSPAKPPAGTPS